MTKALSTPRIPISCDGVSRDFVCRDVWRRCYCPAKSLRVHLVGARRWTCGLARASRSRAGHGLCGGIRGAEKPHQCGSGPVLNALKLSTTRDSASYCEIIVLNKNACWKPPRSAAGESVIRAISSRFGKTKRSDRKKLGRRHVKREPRSLHLCNIKFGCCTCSNDSARFATPHRRKAGSPRGFSLNGFKRICQADDHDVIVTKRVLLRH
jgi:hypothetical protein